MNYKLCNIRLPGYPRVPSSFLSPQIANKIELQQPCPATTGWTTPCGMSTPQRWREKKKGKQRATRAASPPSFSPMLVHPPMLLQMGRMLRFYLFSFFTDSVYRSTVTLKTFSGRFASIVEKFNHSSRSSLLLLSKSARAICALVSATLCSLPVIACPSFQNSS